MCSLGRGPLLAMAETTEGGIDVHAAAQELRSEGVRGEMLGCGCGAVMLPSRGV